MEYFLVEEKTEDYKLLRYDCTIDISYNSIIKILGNPKIIIEYNTTSFYLENENEEYFKIYTNIIFEGFNNNNKNIRNITFAWFIISENFETSKKIKKCIKYDIKNPIKYHKKKIIKKLLNNY